MDRECRPKWVMVLFGLSLICGCAAATVSQRATAFRLPPPKLSPDSIVLEIAQVSVPADDGQWDETVWTDLDEQILGTDLRRALNANGIRVGLAGARLPDPVVQQLGQGPDAGQSASVDIVDEAMSQYRRVQLRSGARSEIVMREPVPTMVFLSDTGQSISGQSLAGAQPQFALVATPRGDGTVSVQLTPEVHHGEAKQKFVGDNGMFRIEPSRDRVTYDQLAVTAELAVGQTLALTGSGPKHSIGGNFFQDDLDPNQKKLLLIRLAQTQHDDLFEE